jgi:RNA polymerase sigma factor (sigma-70 family)
MSTNERYKDPAIVIEDWKRSTRIDIGEDLRSALQEMVRRRVGVLLNEEGIWAPIDPVQLEEDLVSQWGNGCDFEKREVLKSEFHEIVTEVMVNDEPKQVTRWLWMRDESDEPRLREIDENLYKEIKLELQARINRILSQWRFTGVRHKVDQGDLISELYLKLAKGNIPRLPQNRYKFFHLVDKAIDSILRDMQKAARRLRRPQTRQREPLLDIHADDRNGLNQLQKLIAEEDAEEQIAKRLKLEESLKLLPVRQQEIFKLRRNGVSVDETAEILGIARATVLRDSAKSKAFLIKALSDPSGDDPIV